MEGATLIDLYFMADGHVNPIFVDVPALVRTLLKPFAVKSDCSGFYGLGI